VAEIETAIVVALVVIAMVLWIIRRRPERPLPATRAVVGIGAGAIGALVILTNVTDLIPDALESLVGPIAIVAVTAGLMLLMVWKLAN
jgi:hypothetical protein